MKLQTLRRGSAVAAVLTLSISLAACGSDDEPTTGSGSDTPSATEGGASEDPAATETEDSSADPAAQTFGAGCADIPTEGDGSFTGMVDDPVATAASTNPLLTTLVAAVGATELVDTLNSAEALTVFAPADTAFADIQSTVDELLAGIPDAETPATSPLAQILTHHVLAGQIAPDALDGEQTTLNGDKLTISGDETAGFVVSDGTVDANIVCGNIPTANATVYVIDKVLAGATIK